MHGYVPLGVNEKCVVFRNLGELPLLERRYDIYCNQLAKLLQLQGSLCTLQP